MARRRNTRSTQAGRQASQDAAQAALEAQTDESPEQGETTPQEGTQAAPETDSEKAQEEQETSEDTPGIGHNLPDYGLGLSKYSRVPYEPTATNEAELQIAASSLLQEVDTWTVRGDTGIYADLVALIANLCFLQSGDMAYKAAIPSDGSEGDHGLTLTITNAKGITVPNHAIWKDIQSRFMELADKAAVGNKDLLESLNSPSIQAMLPAAYRAGALVAIGVAGIAAFKKGKRPNIADNAEPFGHFDKAKHVAAPAVPRMTIQPMDVWSKQQGTKTVYEGKPCTDGRLTYLSANNALVLYAKVFDRRDEAKKIAPNEKTGVLEFVAAARTPRQPGTQAPGSNDSGPADTGAQPETEKGEATETGEAVPIVSTLDRFNQAAAIMAETQVPMPENVRHGAFRAMASILEGIESLDTKELTEKDETDLVDLAGKLEVICEQAGIARNAFASARERVESVPDVMKLPGDERQELFALYEVLQEKVGPLVQAA